jgi:Zn-dependent M28 family amino/carboxypeptidase
MKELLFFLSLAGLAQAQIQDISGERIRAHVKFLASDLLEGRGPGTRGGQLATEYLAAQFALVGARPAGDNGTYFQKVPLVGLEPQPDSQLSARGKGRTIPLGWLEDFVGLSQRQKPLEQFDAEAIFVGHGIVAPEFQWDDFKGAEVRGKMLVLFTNEPDSTDPKFFGGRALTYYGRWTYKYEQALRMGALGVVIIHTTPTAGYGWNVVKNSWGREQPFVKLAEGEPALALAGWVSSAAAEKLLALAGHSVDELLKASNSRDFRPIPLGFRLRGRLPAKVRALDTANVAAMVEGSDPELKGQAVIFSAHWDHLGIGAPVNGDSIYNGAVDNATGCAMLIEIARAWAALEQKPRRSALFLAVTAEEGGLRGSEYYAGHPIIQPGKTALALNYDAFYPFGRTRDVVLSGAERTTAFPLVEEAARRLNLEIKPDARPEQGSYYRSDHFPLAKAGIPAISIHMGTEFAGKPAGYGEQLFREFNAKHYHQPSDEYHEDWDFSGLIEMARFGMLLGVNAANLESLPTWRPGDEFLPAREKSGVK